MVQLKGSGKVLDIVSLSPTLVIVRFYHEFIYTHVMTISLQRNTVFPNPKCYNNAKII